MTLITHQHKLDTKRIFTGKILSLRVDRLALPGGRELTREVVEHNGGVVIAAQPTDDKILLIKQYRYVIDEELIELPAGRIEVGEEPFATAKRELIEETGFQADTWEPLLDIYSAPGFCNEMLYTWRATNLTYVGKNLDEDEETEVLELSLGAAWQLATEHKIRDAKTVAILGLLYNRHLISCQQKSL